MMDENFNYPVPWDPIRGLSKEEEKEAVARVIEWFGATWPDVRGKNFTHLFPEEDRQWLLRVILPPVLLASRKCLRPMFVNRLKDFDSSSPLWPDFEVGLEKTAYVIHFASSLDRLDLYLKAVTFFYGLSTLLVPQVVEAGDLLSMLSESSFGGSESFQDLASSWFLVVLYPFSTYRTLRIMDGDLVSFLEKRRRSGRATTFIDLWDSESTSEIPPDEIREWIRRNKNLGRLGRLLSDITVFYTF